VCVFKTFFMFLSALTMCLMGRNLNVEIGALIT